MALSPDMSEWLISPGHDAIHASRIGMNKSSDPEILARALSESRIVITCDLDFPRLFALSRASGPGLIRLRGGNYSEAESVECVRRVLMAIPPAELPKCLAAVDDRRVRRRWLPLKRLRLLLLAVGHIHGRCAAAFANH